MKKEYGNDSKEPYWGFIHSLSFEASECGHLHIVKWLVDELKDYYLSYSFHVACKHGHKDIAEFLLSISGQVVKYIKEPLSAPWKML
jgi:hypothetical protein